MPKQSQITNSILVIRPARFGYNPETALSNAFQVEPEAGEKKVAEGEAVREFDRFVAGLKEAGIQVFVLQDKPEPPKPDAVFPNNWISFHSDGTIILYPMQASTRRRERRTDFLDELKNTFEIKTLTDLSDYEEESVFLEGTGSMVLDRVNKVVYACLSPRTSVAGLEIFCKLMVYRTVIFHAVDGSGQDIYHTNVLMALGEEFVVICLECIKESKERDRVLKSFRETGKTLIEINLDQMNCFAGNMLQVKNLEGEKLIVMSTQAYHSLNAGQIKKLSEFGRIYHSGLDTIETLGGGSARCMIAEIFLPVKAK